MGWSKTVRKTVDGIPSSAFRQFQVYRLQSEGMLANRFDSGRKKILATACWSFPIYSHTFVYQELTQFVKSGFDLRFVYAKLDSRRAIASQFDPVWHARRKMILHPKVCQEDFSYFNAKMGDKIDTLVRKICDASGRSAEELTRHHHFYEAFSFVRLAEAYRPDYLHSYFFYEGTFFSLFASYLLNIPRGVSCYADHMLQDYEYKMVPFHLDQCDIVVATSAQIKNELKNIAPSVNPDKILVKPNAINSDAFPVVARKEPETQDEFVIVSVCRIEPKKGLIYLVEAVRILLDRGIQVRLRHLGGADHSEYFNQVNARIKELNLSDHVHLEGSKAQKDIIKSFGKAHIFVAPFIETDYGDKDGIPTSLLEGMSSGLPVIATDAGSISEVVEHGHDGFLVPQRNPAAMADAIASLVNDRDKRKWLGSNAAMKIRSKFDVSVCEQELHERIGGIVSRRRREVD